MKFRLTNDGEGCLPDKTHDTDAGIDLFAHETRVIQKGKVSMLGLGVSVAIPSGCFGMLALRSSAGKKGLCLPNGVGIIDSDYRGELKLLVTSLTDDIAIYKGDKIAQLVILPFISPKLEEYKGDSFSWEQSTNRGAGGFGSTGT